MIPDQYIGQMWTAINREQSILAIEANKRGEQVKLNVTRKLMCQDKSNQIKYFSLMEILLA